MSHDHLSRGVPAQALPENQDPSVQFNLNEVTGVVTPLQAPQPKKKAAKWEDTKKRAAATKATEPTPGVAPKEAPDDPGAGE